MIKDGEKGILGKLWQWKKKSVTEIKKAPEKINRADLAVACCDILAKKQEAFIQAGLHQDLKVNFDISSKNADVTVSLVGNGDESLIRVYDNNMGTTYNINLSGSNVKVFEGRMLKYDSENLESMDYSDHVYRVFMNIVNSVNNFFDANLNDNEIITDLVSLQDAANGVAGKIPQVGTEIEYSQGKGFINTGLVPLVDVSAIGALFRFAEGNHNQDNAGAAILSNIKTHEDDLLNHKLDSSDVKKNTRFVEARVMQEGDPEKDNFVQHVTITVAKTERQHENSYNNITREWHNASLDANGMLIGYFGALGKGEVLEGASEYGLNKDTHSRMRSPGEIARVFSGVAKSPDRPENIVERDPGITVTENDDGTVQVRITEYGYQDITRFDDFPQNLLDTIRRNYMDSE